MKISASFCSIWLIWLLITSGLNSVAQDRTIVTFQKTFGGAKDDVGNAVRQTSDGGYIIVGNSDVGAGSTEQDIYLIKTDAQGEQSWEKTFDVVGISDNGHGVEQTTDGGYIIAGAGLIKTDASGNVEWSKNSAYFINDVKQTPDGGYIAVSGDLIKYDANGNEEWTTTGQGGNAVGLTSDGGYIVTGEYTLSYVAGLIKFDAAGSTEWTQYYGGYSSKGHAVQQTSDGGYIFAGEYQFEHWGDVDLYVVKTDTAGNIEWAKHFGNDNITERGYSVQQTTDGGYIVVGEGSPDLLDYDAWLIKTDASGTATWGQAFSTANDNDGGYSVRQTDDGGYVVAGYTGEVGTGKADVYLVKTDSSGHASGITHSFQPSLPTQKHNIFPNPTSGKFTLQVTNAGNQQINIHNMIGDIVFETIVDGSNATPIDISNLPTGVYLVSVISDHQKEVRKIVKSK